MNKRQKKKLIKKCAIRTPVDQISFENAWDRVCIELNKNGALSWFISPFGYNREKSFSAYKLSNTIDFEHVSNIERLTGR